MAQQFRIVPLDTRKPSGLRELDPHAVLFLLRLQSSALAQAWFTAILERMPEGFRYDPSPQMACKLAMQGLVEHVSGVGMRITSKAFGLLYLERREIAYQVGRLDR